MNNVEELAKFKEKAFKACQEFLGGTWKTIALEDFQLDVVEGGLSNKLFCCTLPENCSKNDETPRKVLMRVYGELQSGQDARLQEITIFTLLSERNLGPKLYGLFSDGRLEEFIPINGPPGILTPLLQLLYTESKSRSLKWDELATYCLSIAVELAKVHTLELPVKRTPLFPNKTYEWLEFAEQNIEPKNLTPFHHMILGGEFRKEMTWIMSEIERMDPPIVFSHNDIQGGNMLLMDSPRADGTDLMLIDFEFGAYNYRSSDLAAALNARCFEFGMADSAFSFHVHLDKYPTESEQIEFIDVYLSQLEKYGISFKNGFQTERNKILGEIAIFRLSLLLYWTIAAIKFNCLSSYNLPFLEMSEQSWEIYEKLKREYMADSCHRKEEHC